MRLAHTGPQDQCHHFIIGTLFTQLRPIVDPLLALLKDDGLAMQRVRVEPLARHDVCMQSRCVCATRFSSSTEERARCAVHIGRCYRNACVGTLVLHAGGKEVP